MIELDLTLTGQLVRQISEHSHYVQGVAWDPLNEYIATQSSDRSVHIYGLKLKDGTCTLSNHGKFHKIDLPGRRISSNSPAPPDPGHRSSNVGEGHRHSTSGEGHRPSNASEKITIVSPSASNPGTPLTTPLPMDPPAISHSRRSSFGSSPSFRRSASPAPGPSLPLPAVRPEISSPSLNAAMGLGVKNSNIYHSETLTSFFRRLTFAPDGSLLFTPSGQYKSSQPSPLDPSKTVDEVSNTVYIYTRAGFNKPPVAHLPGHKKPSVAVKCSPIFYTLRPSQKPTTQITIDTSSAIDSDIPLLPDPVIPTQTLSFMEPPSAVPLFITSDPSRSQSSPKPPDLEVPVAGLSTAFALPYRMVYAVATQDAVIVYDTQQLTPLCVVSNLHFTTFSDLSWYVSPFTEELANIIRSNDGLTLLMSSTDGYCSTLAFTPGELGQIYNGHHPTMTHPTISTGSSVPTPINTHSPSLTKALPAVVPSLTSPAAPYFTMRPTSPARSNSQSSIATMSSVQTPAVTNNPTPTLTHLPMVTATTSSSLVGLPQPTPPQTPMAGGHSATSSVSGSVLGKRDASESEKEEFHVKKRRIAPTLVSSSTTTAPSGEERTKSQVKLLE